MVASAAFAADANASVYMTTDLLNVQTGDSTTIQALKLNKQTQKDADLIQFSFGGEQAGAAFKLWDTFTGGDDALYVHSASLWFKPIEQIKVSVGDIGSYGYTERTNWYKDITGASLSQTSYWVKKYSNYIGVEGAGILAEITVGGLYATLGVAPGVDTFFYSKAGSADAAIAAYGASVKYAITEDISATAAWRDEGLNNAKILSIGADYGKYGAPVYEFINARMYFDDHTKGAEDWGGDTSDRAVAADAAGMTLRGVGIDNWGYFTAGALTVEYRFPITIRGLAKVDGVKDPSYFTYQVKAKYALASCTPYIDINGADAGITFEDLSGTFEMAVQPGVTFNIGECGFDAAVKFSNIKKDGKLAIDVPVTMRVSF